MFFEGFGMFKYFSARAMGRSSKATKVKVYIRVCVEKKKTEPAVKNFPQPLCSSHKEANQHKYNYGFKC